MRSIRLFTAFRIDLLPNKERYRMKRAFFVCYCELLEK